MASSRMPFADARRTARPRNLQLVEGGDLRIVKPARSASERGRAQYIFVDLRMCAPGGVASCEGSLQQDVLPRGLRPFLFF